MEVGLDLFGSGVEALGDGSLSTVSKAESTEVGLSPEVSSYNELDLGLGLSLGSSGGGGVASKPNTCPWGEYGRILTAKDFPSSLGTSSSSSSSSSGKAAAGITISPCSATKAAVSGTKRAADESVAQEGGSASGAVSNQVVGWPPLRSSRINILVNQTKNPSENDKVDTKHKDITKKKTEDWRSNGNAQKKCHLKKSLFVKVNMDGVPIGRKVDLNAHTCYETLAGALEDMFFYRPTTTTITNFIRLKEEKEQGAEAEKTSRLLGGLSEFVLTYEDKDGDWMLVGDVPWGMFVNTAKRLKIMRTSEANGLAPRSDGSSGRQRNKPI